MTLKEQASAMAECIEKNNMGDWESFIEANLQQVRDNALEEAANLFNEDREFGAGCVIAIRALKEIK